MRFAVVDLFAGAGGLGEGFSRAGFDNVLSCEAEATFTETLKLRHFARYTSQEGLHKDYYRFLTGELELGALYARHPEAASKASASSLKYKLGSETKNKTFHERLRQQVGGRNSDCLGGHPVRHIHWPEEVGDWARREQNASKTRGPQSSTRMRNTRCT